MITRRPLLLIPSRAFLVNTLEALYDQSLAPTSFTLVMLAIAGAMALGLGIVGIYGVIAYLVSQRTREIGIRMALGAQQKKILRMVVGQGARMALLGIAIGLVASFGLTRIMSSMLFGVSATDPLTFAAVLVLLLAAALGLLRPGTPRSPRRSHGRFAPRITFRKRATRRARTIWTRGRRPFRGFAGGRHNSFSGWPPGSPAWLTAG